MEKNNKSGIENKLPKTGVDNTSLIIIGALLVAFSSIGIVKLRY